MGCGVVVFKALKLEALGMTAAPMQQSDCFIVQESVECRIGIEHHRWDAVSNVVRYIPDHRTCRSIADAGYLNLGGVHV
jgi:hypothetical protein